jgi:hypothetical protein
MTRGGHQFKRPCITCGVIALGTYCDEHKPKRPRGPESTQRRRKKSHLYGGTYAKRAKQVRMTAEICHICKEGGRVGDPWEADHATPELGHASLLLPAHRSCNRKRGNTPINPNTHTNTHNTTPTTGINRGRGQTS